MNRMELAKQVAIEQWLSCGSICGGIADAFDDEGLSPPTEAEYSAALAHLREYKK